jgi:hypothetical protein
MAYWLLPVLGSGSGSGSGSSVGVDYVQGTPARAHPRRSCRPLLSVSGHHLFLHLARVTVNFNLTLMSHDHVTYVSLELHTRRAPVVATHMPGPQDPLGHPPSHLVGSTGRSHIRILHTGSGTHSHRALRRVCSVKLVRLGLVGAANLHLEAARGGRAASSKTRQMCDGLKGRAARDSRECWPLSHVRGIRARHAPSVGACGR